VQPLGALLAFASKKFAVEADPKVEAIINALPGANCGACGYPGCAGLAAAIAAGKMPVESCPVGGARVAAKVGQIMGQNSFFGRRCQSLQRSCVAVIVNQRGQYTGIETCRAANLLGGGAESCAYGCLGFGDCVRVCPFDAITMNDKGIPVIDEDKCQTVVNA
jgi:RnfABCDGE-type electron transport complex B subunit